MVKLVIFDLDGVLVDAKEIHYEALNRALESLGFSSISRDDHISKYDGLPTKTKLRAIGYTDDQIELISIVKQQYTIQAFKKIQPNEEIRWMMEDLVNHRFKIAIASNAVRATIDAALRALDIHHFFYPDFQHVFSNEDVRRPKPHPEIYMRAMLAAGVAPDETLIVEDSVHGREAAVRSGAHLCPVNSPSDLSSKFIYPYLHPGKKGLTWRDDKLNILIPMAGAGSRFAQAGYTFPKPLIEIKSLNSKPMIQAVVENLNIEANFIFIVQQEHCEKYNLKQLLNLVAPGCTVVVIDGVTEGAACTTLLAKEFIDNDQPLLLANSDQIVDWDSRAFLYAMNSEADAGMVTFEAYGVKWSYARVEDGFVTEVAEKNPISNVGTVGIYWWAKGSDYVKYAEQMITKDARVNGEFYVAPVFNEAIADGKLVKPFHIDKMWGIGDPESLDYFVENYNRD